MAANRDGAQGWDTGVAVQGRQVDGAGLVESRRGVPYAALVNTIRLIRPDPLASASSSTGAAMSHQTKDDEQ